MAYLLKEDRESFIVKVDTLEEAYSAAEAYNATVLEKIEIIHEDDLGRIEYRTVKRI